MASGKEVFQYFKDLSIEQHVNFWPTELRDHARRIYSAPAEFTPIIICSFIEELVDDLLRARLIKHPKLDGLLNRTGLRHKVDFCAMVGVMPDWMGKAIHGTIDIRDDFAHKTNPSYVSEKSTKQLKAIWESVVKITGNALYYAPEITKKDGSRRSCGTW